MKNIEEYKSVGEWFNDARQEGYNVPLAMCRGIEIAMKELNKSFSEIFKLFEQEKIIIQEGKFFIYDVRGHKAIKGKNNK